MQNAFTMGLMLFPLAFIYAMLWVPIKHQLLFWLAIFPLVVMGAAGAI